MIRWMNAIDKNRCKVFTVFFALYDKLLCARMVGRCIDFCSFVWTWNSFSRTATCNISRVWMEERCSEYYKCACSLEACIFIRSVRIHWKRTCSLKGERGWLWSIYTEEGIHYFLVVYQCRAFLCLGQCLLSLFIVNYATPFFVSDF